MVVPLPTDSLPVAGYFHGYGPSEAPPWVASVKPPPIWDEEPEPLVVLVEPVLRLLPQAVATKVTRTRAVATDINARAGPSGRLLPLICAPLTARAFASAVGESVPHVTP